MIILKIYKNNILIMNPKILLIGNRIPKDYFITKGIGESDCGQHSGSFHLSLKDAGIEQYNIITYSSILPSIAEEVKKPENIVHGSVMECIMSCAHSLSGEQATAGIIYGWLYDKETNKKYGGLVCEHNGNYDIVELESRLRSSIEELYFNGFDEKYELADFNMITNTMTPTKKYGCALVSICFTSYEYPIIE